MKFERPLNEYEINKLDKRLKRITNNYKRQIKFLFIWVLIALCIGLFAFSRIDSTNSRLLLIVTGVIYIGIGFWVTIEERIKQNKERLSINYLKNKNIVKAVIVKSDKYYQLTEKYDEGDYYLFQLANNEILFFGGEDFCPTETFPCNDFEICEGIGLNNEILLKEIYNYGIKIDPTLEITGQDKWDIFKRDDFPGLLNISILSGQIESYVPEHGK